MFQVGKSYKVKVEFEPGKIGFGRATVLERTGNRLYIQLSTGNVHNYMLPSGSQLWLINDAQGISANGLWSTSIIGTKIIAGKTALELKNPKFEPMVQNRQSYRVPLSCPVTVETAKGEKLPYKVQCKDISRSGIGLETDSEKTKHFPIGDEVIITLETRLGQIPLECKIIRTQYNWLNKHTVIGLQFVSISQEAVEMLEQLRQSGTEAAFASDEGEGQSLSKQLKANRDDMSLTKSRIKIEPPSEEN